MKKAKIFLTVLTVMAVVGGALAFKGNPKKFARVCNLSNLKCQFQTFITEERTTNVGPTVPYDLLDAPCHIIDGVPTCITQTSIDQ